MPGLVAKDVVDLQVGVASLDDADDPGFVASMDAAGFVRMPGEWHDNGKDGTTWPKRFHGSCDPGRVAHVHVREVGSPGWEWALRFRDWLRADAGERAAYATMKTELATGRRLDRGLRRWPRSRGSTPPTSGPGPGPSAPAGGRRPPDRRAVRTTG